MEELVVMVFKAMWGIVQAIYYLIRFIIQTIFFIRAKIPKKPEAYELPERTRFEHTLIVGGSGHGKTQLLQYLFVNHDLDDVIAGRKSVVFIDSQGDMLQKILHLAELTPSRAQEVAQLESLPATAQPQQGEVQQNVVPETLPKTRTGMSRLWHSGLVFLLHVFVLALIIGIAALAQAYRWSDNARDNTFVLALLVFGFIAGAWLRTRAFAPTYAEAFFGAAVFLSIVAGLARQADAVLVCLFISFSLGLGFILTHLIRFLFRKKGAPASAPVEAVSQTAENTRVVPAVPSRPVVSQAVKSINRPTLADRLVLIDPNDVENPPCLNLFDFGLDRIKDYSPVDREKFVNSAIALYEYMFGALLGAELSHRQGVIFRYLARLLMVVPNPTIYTLMDFMEEPERVRPFLPKLDIQTQRFFVTQFFSHKFDDTRQQILTRLWGVLSNNVLARMFSHTENKLNLFEAMNRGSLILINTAKDLLKQEGCEIFGRFMITCISQATQERAALPEEKRLPSFIYIDEAADYFDDSLEELLNTARKYIIGLIIATQNLGQFSQKLLASVLSSTSIKFVGGVSNHDAKALAPEMKTDPEFILSMQKGGGQTQFVMYVRNDTPEAVGFNLSLGDLERRAKMSGDDFKELLKQNREKYTAPYEPELLEASAAIAQSGITFALDDPQRPI